MKFLFPLTDTTGKVLFVLINTIVMITSVFGNGIVMFVIITRQRLHQPTYYLIFSLALSDFIVALFGQSTYATEIAFKDYTSCIVDRIVTFLNGASCSTSLMLLCMISRDRWLHVAKGLRYSEYTSNKQVMIISLACCIISMSISLPFCFDVNYMRIFSSLGFVVNGITCFIAICIINVKVHRLVKRHFDDMEINIQDAGPVGSTRSKHDQERAKVERSVNRSIIAVIMVYSIFWFPMIIVLVTVTIHNLYDKEVAPELRIAFAWTATVSYFNGAINPFIYAYRCDNIGCDIRAFILNTKRKVFPG